MWGQLSSAAGQFKRTINAVASEIKDAVEEVRTLDEDPYPQAARHPGQEVPQTVSAPSSTRGARAPSTSSRLEAIKARLEAEKTGSSSSSSRPSPGVSQEVPPVPSYGCVQHQSHQPAQRAVLGAPPFNSGPASTPAANWASASAWKPGTAQAGAAPEQETPPQHAQAALVQQKDGGQHGTSQAPPWNAASAQHLPADIRHATLLQISPGQRGGAEDAEKLRSQMQHLKAELMATAAAHEEEEMRLGQRYEQRIQAAEARNAELAQLLEKSKASNDSHARIMELQVRLKEEQSEKARLLDQLAITQPSSAPFSSAAQQPEADEEAFWEQAAAAADGDPSSEREAPFSGAGVDVRIAVLQQQLEQSRAEASEQLSSERAAHEATHAALELRSQQGQELEGQLRSAEAALRSEQSAISDLRAELTQTQTLHAELQQWLASHNAAEQHSEEITSQALQAQVQDLQAEIAQLRAAAADTARQQQALEVGQAGHAAVVSELEAERAKRTESEDALRALQLRTDEAAQALAADQASLAEMGRRLSELESALDKAQTASASHEGSAAQLVAALADLERERREHSQAQLENLRLSEQAAESAEARAAAEKTLQALEASHNAQALPADLEQLHAELRQALQSAAQQGEQALKAEDELRGCMRDKEALAGSVAELEGRCRQLQGKLEVVTQQLHQTKQDSKAVMSAQLAEAEAAWKDALEDSQQKLQDALYKIADLERQTQDQQPTSSPGPLLPESNGHSMKTNPLLSEAYADASGLKEKLAETEKELERTKQQLQRLKQATVMRQEDEENSMRWRVEAEVRLAVDRAQQASAQQEAQMHKDMADLSAELAHAREQLDGQSSDLSAWRDAVVAKDLEIQNLQAALGELAYKSETAERLRLDLRGQTAKLREAEERCQSTQQALQASEASQQALEQKLKIAGEQLEKQRGLENRLMDEAAMLRRALSQSMQQLKLANSDAGAMVDRRIVTKLLLTWVERGRSDQSVLNLMASMLGFTDEEKRRFGIAHGPGLIKAVAGAPIALIKGLATSGEGKGRDGLADQWVEFLIEQANAADAVQTPGPSRSTSIDQGNRQLV